MSDLKRIKPFTYNTLKSSLEKEMEELKAKLSDSPVALSAPERLDCERRLWVIKGVLDHGFNKAVLETIACKYKRIDCAPNGYDYPELYMRMLLS